MAFKIKPIFVIEVVSVTVGVVAVPYLLQSTVNDFRRSEFSLPSSINGTRKYDELLNLDSGKKPITAKVIAEFESRYGIEVVPQKQLLEIKELPKSQQDSFLRPKILESKMQHMERRIAALEGNSVSIWTYIKGVTAWLLTTFLTPGVAHLGKRALQNCMMTRLRKNVYRNKFRLCAGLHKHFLV